MLRHIPPAARIGLALVLTGGSFFVSVSFWQATRIWVPVNVPISLSRGQTQTNDFKLNFSSSYTIYVVIGGVQDYQEAMCLTGAEQCPDKSSILQASWTLFDNGKSVITGDADRTRERFGGWGGFGESEESGNWKIFRRLGTFSAKSGKHYRLNIDIQEDASRLNSRNARLIVRDEGQHWIYGSLGNELFLLGVNFICFGLILFVGSMLLRYLDKRTRMPVSLTSVGLPTKTLYVVEEKPPSVSRELYTTNAKLRAWIGAFMLALGIASFAGIYYWFSTRTFFPVDMPISLAPGHISTGSFLINLKGDYDVEIETGDGRLVPPECHSYDFVKANWTLLSNGRVVERWNEGTPYTYLGAFASEKRTYDLELNVLSDSGCLNPGHPRLRVYIVDYVKKSYADLAALVMWISAFVAAIGVCLFLLNIGVFRATESPDSLRLTDSGSPLEHFQWAQKLPLKKTFTGLPSFGLFGAICAVAFLIPIWIVTTWHTTSVGLRVLLLKPGAAVAANDRWAEPTVVRILDVGAGKEPRLYVGSKLVAWKDLRTRLNQEIFRHPPGQPVYVEADPELPWADIEYVVDEARGLKAEVVMVTTKPQVH
jgi:biopolymer transport protein ExbD